MGKKTFAIISLFFIITAEAHSFPVEIKHDAGTTRLLKKPEKIVALNWTQAEILLTLGITPVGVTSIQGYRKWQGDFPPMPDSVTELGTRSEPSLEKIAALHPDLIIGYNWRHSKILPQLEKIAPTLLYKQYPSSSDREFNYFDQMIKIFKSVSKAVDKEKKAEKILMDLNHSLKNAQITIADSDIKHSLVIGKFVGMGLGLRVYGENSMAGCLIKKTGIKQGWSSTLPGRDFTHIELAQLTAVKNSSLLLIGGDLSEAMTMKKSPVWKLIPAVKENRIYELKKLWSFGGPIAAIRMLEAIKSSVTGEKNE